MTTSRHLTKMIKNCEKDYKLTTCIHLIYLFQTIVLIVICRNTVSYIAVVKLFKAGLTLHDFCCTHYASDRLRYETTHNRRGPYRLT